MDIEKVLNVVSRQAPCAHDNANTDLGSGKVWAVCEDCGATFPQDRWENARQASKDFDDAIFAVRGEIARLRDENAKLRLEVDAWRERFKGYEYRRQDDVVALKLHDYGPGEPA